MERAGQNFALSEDGLRLAVVRETMVRHPATKDYEAYTAKETAAEVYALPPLTEKDQAAVKAAEALAPADSWSADRPGAGEALQPGGSGHAAARRWAGRAGGRSAAGAAAGGAPAATGSEAQSGAGTTTVVEGDPDPDAPRKPPTLYGPDEKPGSSPR